MEQLKKFGIPMLLAAIGIAIAVVMYSVITTPGGKSPEEVAQEKTPVTEPAKEMLSVAQLQINRLEQNLQTSEENIQKMFKNQTELNNSLTQTGKQLEINAKTMKDQRAYIAMIYQKMLELELKTESLGGGLSGTGKPRANFNAPNPLQGTDALPATPAYDPGVLPPLPEFPER